MPMTEQEIRDLIKEALPDAIIDLRDLRGDGDYYQAYIESKHFTGKTRVQQHQMVFAALQGRVGGILRNLSLTTAIPKT